ncbi:Conidiophore development regulator abaA [Dissostichus eleginoides]|uniref:Conidiophore development regulator abaA n=1 Tax=Dissostichus eleginoides TaxID=100907 RepID=A0AAD9FH36_DISEL|nr:Conidiophore development regulator abaA [Dissostichus eleginoides]
MEVKPVLFALFLVLFLFTTVSGVSSGSEHPIVYTRDQLLAFRSMAMLTGDRPAVPRELRRRRRGRRAGAKLRQEDTIQTCPSIYHHGEC